MTNILHRSMLGVLLVSGLMAFTVATPVFAESTVTATKEIPATITVGAKPETTATISQDDLAALKTALDGLHNLLVSLDGYVSKLPKESQERAAIATGMNATLTSMSANLTALNGTLATITVTPGKSLAEANPTLVAPNKADVLAANPDKTNTESAAANDVAATDDSKNKGILSVVKESLNSPPGVIILLVFALIFGVIVFMRLSSKEEARPTA